MNRQSFLSLTFLFVVTALSIVSTLTGCTISSDSSNALTSWDDSATANREKKQEELIRKQDAVLKRQQHDFEDLHIQEQIQNEYKRRNLRQSDNNGDDDYH